MDFPDTAKFLSAQEKAFVLHASSRSTQDHSHRILTLSEYSSVGEDDTFSKEHIYSAFQDWQIWMHILIYMAIVAPGKSNCLVF